MPVDAALELEREARYDRVVQRGESRRFERIPCDHRGELVVYRNDQSAPVTVRTLSLGGLGMTFDEWDELEVQTGSLVTVRLQLDGRTVDLPGHVAWIEPSVSKRFDLGVELDLERADMMERDTYLRWVRGAL